MAATESKSTTRPYLVGYATGEPDTLKVVGVYTAATPKGAVEEAVKQAGDEFPAGTVNFVAVVQSSWQTFHGKGEMKMVFTVSTGHARKIQPPELADDMPPVPQPDLDALEAEDLDIAEAEAREASDEDLS